MEDSIRSRLPAILLFLMGLVFWQFIVGALEVPRYILPAPTTILERIWLERLMLIDNLRATMLAAVIGFAIGVAAALALGTLFLYSKTAEKALMPWTIVIKTIPALAIAPLLTIWLGFGLAPKVAIAAIASFFPILVNFHRGLGSISSEIGELLDLLGASTAQSLLKVRLFASLPFTFAAFKISSGAAVLAAIVAEFTGANRGIGTLIVTSGYQQDAVMLFAAIIVSCAATILFYYLVVIAERVCLYWPDAVMRT
ncbi:MAG: ABC transporter permease [Proteobacteria bacterium]|nr:ABC transporter permease [Pseudomonadota bacterium]MBI3495997.1 ABC transporter permease [Pseudomonadota bacterium]